MPEYCLPDSYAAGFKALDSFTQGYIECLFFTENGNDGISEDAGFLDLAPEALERIKSDCADFQIANAADLSEADLGGADLSRADLSRANLGGADLSGTKIKQLLARAGRLDGYEFFAFETDQGLIVRAGCRQFTIAEYRAHVEAQYPGTDKARETSDILDFFEKRASP